MNNVDRNHKTDALVAAGSAGDGGVQPHDFAREIAEWSTGMSEIDGGFGLNHVLPLHIVVAQVQIVPPFCAHDAEGHALAKSNRADDGEHKVANLPRVA